MQGGGELKVTSLFFVATTFSCKMQVLDEALLGFPFCSSSYLLFIYVSTFSRASPLPPVCSLFFLFSLCFLLSVFSSFFPPPYPPRTLIFMWRQNLRLRVLVGLGLVDYWWWFPPLLYGLLWRRRTWKRTAKLVMEVVGIAMCLVV